jgi:phenylalanyl-tRNA synthetase beta chain
VHLSYRWLARHVDLGGITPQQLAADLTLSTAEVESLARFAPVLSEVVVGYVQERKAVPESDHLSLCRVDVGESESLQIVCGANNVAQGQKVAVAKVGTRLSEELKIKKTKIRGFESCGMICSERELGLGDEHSGIWVLDAESKVGAPVAQALGLEDWVIEIDNKSITHRPDLWGHRGFAAEVAAIYRRELKPLDASLPDAGAGKSFPVRVEAPECSRYVALSIDGARAGKSPEWLRMLLLAAGQRSIDLLVDLSNFVMLDLGEPNHLFDRGRLSPEGIVVRRARAGERLTTLDGVARALEPSDLLICSGQDPVALAGIMGGEGSKVSADTSSLLLECATFHAATVRRTASRLGLRTDSSARFEKSLSPTIAATAAGHFLRLLQRIQPQVRLSAPVTDVGAWKDPARSIELRSQRVRQVLGTEIDDAAIGDILARLGLQPKARPGGFEVRIPSERATKDLTGEHDLIEELGRIHRYGEIAERAIIDAIAPVPRDERRALARRIEDRLAGSAHFHQTISYSFVSDDLLGKLRQLDAPHVAVVNPVAEGLSRIRRSVLPSLLAVAEHNRRQRAEVRLFEIGKGYRPQPGGAEPREVHQLGLLWIAPPTTPSMAKGARFDADRLHQLQGVLEDLFRHLGLEPVTWQALAAGTAPTWAHPGRCLTTDVAREGGGEEPLATLANLEPGLARELGLSGELESDVALAEVSLDALLAAPRRAEGYRPIPRFPGVKVDVALALPEAVTAAQGVAAIEKSGKGLVAGTELFDLYSGPNLGPGRRSLAWHVLLQADARTLNDEDVQKFLARLEREAREGLGGELRRADGSAPK